MKTVKGEVISTTPISLSKTSSILSKFVSADTGASQAVCAYLRRASVSFNELNQLHKELKLHRKHKTHESRIKIEEDGDVRKKLKNNKRGKILVKEEEMKKKKRKSEEIEEGRATNSEESRIKKKTKKRKNEGEIEKILFLERIVSVRGG